MKLLGLKSIRNIYGFTMRDLAQRINVSANLINLWESGDVDVPDIRIDNLSNYLGIEKQLLFKEEHDIEDLLKIEISRSNFKIKEYSDRMDKDKKKELLKDLFNIDFNVDNKEKNEYKDYYKYIFTFSNLTITVAAKSKIDAINKLQAEYIKKFEENFTINKVDFEINIDGIEERYL